MTRPTDSPIKYTVTAYVSGLKIALDSFQATDDGVDKDTGVRWFVEPSGTIREYPAKDYVFFLDKKRASRIKQIKDQKEGGK